MTVGALAGISRPRRSVTHTSFRALLTWGPRVDGRLVFLGIVAAYFMAVIAGRLLWNFDLWGVLGVPSRPTVFLDARNLTAAWECHRLGYDPLYENPCDPRGRPLMYLRPWLLFSVFGLDQADTFVLSVSLIAVMFASFVLLVGPLPAGAGVVLALAACSPAVMFAIERANMDIALFTVIAAAVLLWRTFPRRAAVLSPALVFVAATAKLYPLFALPAFVLTRSRVAARAAFACIAVFGVYCVYAFRDIAHVAEIATQGDHLSYGARILPAHLYHQIGADRWAGPAVVKQLLAMLPLAGVAAAIVLRVQRQFATSSEETQPGTSLLLAFHAGALIYLGTFALANNFDYRLVFLLLTLPQLIDWARSPTDRRSRLAAVTLVAVLALLWVSSLSQQLNLWDELASWTVAGLLAATVAATMPSLRVMRRSLLGAGGSSRPAARIDQ